MRAGAPPNRAWPTMVAELDPIENLIVWSYRSWAMAVQRNGETRWRLLRYEYRRQFGADAGETALHRFSALMRQFGGHARAPMSYHAPCCPCLGEHEVAVLSLVAACQARRWLLARRIATCLVATDGIGSVIGAASGVADVMRRHLPELPLRLSGDAAGRAGDHTCAATAGESIAVGNVTIH
jgi:hypothetical protein